MATLTLLEARNLMLRERPWTLRLGSGNRFWVLTGRARQEPVELHSCTGSNSTITIRDWDFMEKEVPEKIAEGWAYQPTPYVPVRKTTINAWNDQANQPKVAALAAAPTGPWALVQSVTIDKGEWWGLDANGRRVIQLTLNGARSMVQKNPGITVLGL